MLKVFTDVFHDGAAEGHRPASEPANPPFQLFKLKPASGSGLLVPHNENDSPWEKCNRIYSRLLLKGPIGLEIHRFKSYTQLLLALHDCICGHRELYQKAKILHRDISINNVLINVNLNVFPAHGFIVDLDLAIRSDRKVRSDSDHQTGTFYFMAIDILLDKATHSYRHDLESFLYVLIYLCTYFCGPDDQQRPNSEISRNIFNLQGDVKATGSEKLRMMAETNFMNELLDTLQDDMRMHLEPVLVGWRRALFRQPGDAFSSALPHDDDDDEILSILSGPEREKMRKKMAAMRKDMTAMRMHIEKVESQTGAFTGTPPDENALYEEMLQVLNDQIDMLGGL